MLITTPSSSGFSYRYLDRMPDVIRWALITLISTVMFAACGHAESGIEADALPVLTLTEPINDIRLRPYLVYKSDSSGSLTPTQAATVNYSKVPEGFGGAGTDVGINWFKFSIRNPFNEPKKLLLDTKLAFSFKTDLYSLSAHSLDEPALLHSVSARDSLSERPFYHHNIILPVNIPSNAQLTFLYRSDDFHLWSMRITDYSHFISSNHLAKIFMFFYGFSVGLLIYNLFLWVTTRESAFLFYSLFIISFLIMTGIFNGTLLYFLPIEWLGKYSIQHGRLAGCLVGITFCQFTRLYLDLKQCSKTMDWLQVLFMGCFSALFCAYILQLHVPLSLVPILWMAFMVTEFLIALILFLRKHTAAKYYLIAFSLYIMSTILVVLASYVEIRSLSSLLRFLTGPLRR